MTEIDGESQNTERLPISPLFEFDYHGKHFQVREEAKRVQKDDSLIENLVVYEASTKSKVGMIHEKKEKVTAGEQFTSYSSVNSTLDRQTGLSQERGIIKETIIQAVVQVFNRWRSSIHLNPTTGVPLYQKISQDPRVIVRQEPDGENFRQIVTKNLQ